MTHPAFAQSVSELTVNRIKSIKATQMGDARDCAIFFVLSDYAEYIGVDRRYILLISSLRAHSQKHAKCVGLLRGFIAQCDCDVRVLAVAA